MRKATGTKYLAVALLVLIAGYPSSASNVADFNLILEGNSLSVTHGIPDLIEDLALLGIASGQSTPTVSVMRMSQGGGYTATRLSIFNTDGGYDTLRKSRHYDKPAPGEIDLIVHQEHWPGRMDVDGTPLPQVDLGYPATGYQSTADLYSTLHDAGVDAPMTIYSTWGPRRTTPTKMRRVFMDRGKDWDDVILEIQGHGFAAARYAEQVHGLDVGEIGLIPIGQHWIYYDQGPGEHNDLYNPDIADLIHQGDRGALLTAMLVLSSAVEFDPSEVDTSSQAFTDFLAEHPVTIEDWQAVMPYGSTESMVTPPPTSVPTPNAVLGAITLLGLMGIRRRRA